MKKEILRTEEAISFTKEIFESELKQKLALTKISSPIAILNGTGINDDLNGIERVVAFPIKALSDKEAVVVNSLSKWKRLRLQELDIEEGKGIITDMRAIRPDEDYSSIHSIYVDQWDWEKRISKESRNITFLKEEVTKIYKALRETEIKISEKYDSIQPVLPQNIKFIHTEELLQKYPTLTPKERESEITKEYGAVFLIGIGGNLSSEKPHDGRAPDYDDWSSENEDGYFGLNGDILLWHPILKESFEISSMGIRVDKLALLDQLNKTGQNDRKELQFHKLLLNEILPESIGGGIGQSRVCMFMLRKKHIGEVQVGIWPDSVKEKSKEEGIMLL
ncbi:aspartate--ammonia ligase, AsnA-type [Owenweeksia hongkongensis DSM 17368]|uniref:Aspartate--ammonia ligase n=1 Tax=Owenweeksia hongkongensis (strain DSM 17368 / CIP 108786 / JCM 12287 / NRRL B-23963 / UST20020801) TaxID=926562 RepID=G8R4I3_OWEHD|nr:aspartate--ammonia ligase [Owenweeksia hongkongensis]AEV32072.1 aspartate--ammonia ligase, AsnA-type [Owenweeksia hongkongensis DSM 17368]